jgi:hypothetical protein
MYSLRINGGCMFFRHEHFCWIAALMFASSASSCPAQATPYICEKNATYLAIQVPGALGTYPVALNDAMTVTGYYTVSPSVARAFIRDQKGAIATFSVPRSKWTQPESINTAGDIAGFFETETGTPQGFLRYANGRLMTFTPPDVDGDRSGALPLAINDYDLVAGNQQFNDFVRTRTGTYLHPGYTVDPYFFTTGLTSSGSVVGFNYGALASYVVHPDGYFEEFQVPYAQNFCDQRTAALSINEAGTIAGWFSYIAWAPVDSPSCSVPAVTGGFVRSPEGQIALFQAPGTIVTALTVWGRPITDTVTAALSSPGTLKISAQGIITGSYIDDKQAQHGFVRDTDGVITSFDPPQGKNTTAMDINASGAITGSYFSDCNTQTAMGFLRIPTH